MKWTTRKTSCAANESPSTTEAPARKETGFAPRIAVGRFLATLLKQINVATEVAAATAHNNVPSPNQSAPEFCSRSRIDARKCQTRHQQRTISTEASNAAETMAVTLVADDGSTSAWASMTWMMNRAVVVRTASEPNTAGRQRETAILGTAANPVGGLRLLQETQWGFGSVR